MTYLYLFLEFFKIGLFTFGGGYAMIPLIREVVLKYGWLTEEQFTNFIGICESTPGPIAVNMATYIGSTQGGLLGSILASLAVILPSFIIIVLIASILKNFTKNKYFQRALLGIKAVVIGLIISTGLLSILKCIGYVNLAEFHFSIPSVVIFGLLITLYFIHYQFRKKKLSPIVLILIAGILGLIICPIFA